MINFEEINKIENINRDNLITGDKNFLVEAGAGAGKTFLLVNRLIDLILNKNIKPKEIVAITFTVKSATDLKSKIYSEFKKRSKTDKRIKDILEFIPEIQIGTIHSFCNSIISRRPFDAGLAMDYRLLEDLEYQRYLTRVYEDFENNLYKYVDKNTANIFLKLNHRVRIIDNFSKFAMNDSVEFPVLEGFENYDEVSFLDELKDILSNLSILKTVDSSAFRKAAINPIYNIENILNLKDKNAMMTSARELYKLAKLNPDNPFIKKNLPKALSDTKKEKARALIDTTLDEVNRLINIMDLWQKIIYRTHVRVSLAFVEYLDEMNKKNSVISNDDLLRYSLNILMKMENREYFQDIYKYIFVDESQDTDLVQIKIILSLVSEGEIKKDTPIIDYNLLPNRIFMVGDRKQSIYRFRGADLNTYEIVKNLFEKTDNAEFVSLKKSFRFKKNLAHDIEKCFENEVTSKYGNYDLGVGQILVNDDVDNGSGIFTTKLNTDTFEEEVNKYTKKDLINQLVRTEEDRENFILNSLFSKEKVQSELDELEESSKNKISFLKSSNEGLYLKAKFLIIDLLNEGILPEDILVLTMGNEGARMVTNVLREEGFKVDSTSEENYFSYESVKRAYVAIRFFENPTTSNYFEFAIKILSKDPVCLKNEISKINNLGFASYIEEKPGILCDEEYNFIIKYLNLFKNNKDSAMMSLYYEDIFFDGKYSENEYETFYSFFREILNNGSNLGNIKEKCEVTFKPGKSDTLRVMNIHKAKGLEAKNIVLIEERNLNINSDDYFDRMNNKGYLEFSTGSLRNMILDHGNDEARENSILENFKEYVRLFYVAITRAKENVYLVSKGGFYEEQLSFANTKEIFVSNYNRISTKNNAKSFKDSLYYPIAPVKIKPYEEVKLELTNNIYHGTYYGIIFHKVMERAIDIIKSKSKLDIYKVLKLSIKDFLNDDDIDSEIYLNKFEIDNNENLEEKIFDKLKDQVFTNVKNNVNLLKDRIEGSKETYTELPFTYSKEGHIINGRMDLILIFDDSIEIYDYKTDIDISEKSQKYILQLELYRDAASELLKIDKNKIKTKILRSN